MKKLPNGNGYGYTHGNGNWYGYGYGNWYETDKEFKKKVDACGIIVK